jgi:quinoprotein dehydrogenase-associated probable ABC transporter substrate-binding protein
MIDLSDHRRGGATFLSASGAVAILLAAASAFAQHVGPDAVATGADDKGSIELVDPKVLRVCADPNNLPFSNEKGEGFENKIAEFLARRLRKDLAYAFYPGATGFVRNTLNAHLCDVILGMPQGNDLVQPTNPYYRTTYAVVTRAGSDVDDPRWKEKPHRIGLVANTPPGNVLARNGMMSMVRPYPLMIDTRVESSSAAMIHDLETGEIDAALLWGPIAGYYAKHSGAGLHVTPLQETQGARMAFRICFGVRRADQNWKRELNQIIAENKGELEKILVDYGVPLLDENDHPISQAPAKTP